MTHIDAITRSFCTQEVPKCTHKVILQRLEQTRKRCALEQMNWVAHIKSYRMVRPRNRHETEQMISNASKCTLIQQVRNENSATWMSSPNFVEIHKTNLHCPEPTYCFDLWPTLYKLTKARCPSSTTYTHCVQVVAAQIHVQRMCVRTTNLPFIKKSIRRQTNRKNSVRCTSKDRTRVQVHNSEANSRRIRWSTTQEQIHDAYDDSQPMDKIHDAYQNQRIWGELTTHGSDHDAQSSWSHICKHMTHGWSRRTDKLSSENDRPQCPGKMRRMCAGRRTLSRSRSTAHGTERCLALRDDRASDVPESFQSQCLSSPLCLCPFVSQTTLTRALKR